MKTAYKAKKTHDLNDKEFFKFIGDNTNYQVVDYIYYKKVGTKKKVLLPINQLVQTFKTLR